MAASDAYSAYKRVDVETASQGKLIVLMFNGAISRAEDAKRAIAEGDVERTHNQLIRAQDIIAELRSALNMNVGELAENLDRVYEYAHHMLVDANVKKDASCIDIALQVLTEMRDTWKHLFEQVEQDVPAVPPAPRINQHGASVMNLEG